MSPAQGIAALAALAIFILGTLAFLVWSWRRSPEQRERRRRRSIYEMGRMGDGMLTDVRDNVIYYSYSVNGVDYNTSQDATALRNMVPADESLIIGPVTLKYMARNPGNSIVVCEDWSGLRIRTRTASVSSLPS